VKESYVHRTKKRGRFGRIEWEDHQVDLQALPRNLLTTAIPMLVAKRLSILRSLTPHPKHLRELQLASPQGSPCPSSKPYSL
jgi:hypothetical protein